MIGLSRALKGNSHIFEGTIPYFIFAKENNNEIKEL
jgi:hypothetical protein